MTALLLGSLREKLGRGGLLRRVLDLGRSRGMGILATFMDLLRAEAQ